MSPAPSLEERFDPKIAAKLVEYGNGPGGGLPDYLGVVLERFEPGRLWARATVREEHLTPFGNAHGGVLAALVDHVTGMVVYPLMQPGQWAATTEVKLNYIAPVPAGELRATADVLAMTRRSAVVRGEVHAGDRLVCAAQGTLTIVDPKR